MRKIVIACLIATAGAHAYAGALDNWLSTKQETYTAPGYFEGQKRGYVVGGSYGARIRPSTSESLFNIEKPYLKTGCGGIDLFMGSFSFLNTDWLIQKGQQMIQAAPFIAFDLALSVLSPQISEKYKAAMSIIDQLNQLQIDECQATTGIVARVMSQTPGITEDAKKSLTEKAASNEIVKGGSQLWSDITNFGSKSDSLQNNASFNEQTKGCPAEVKQFYQPGSMLANVSAKYAGMVHSDYIDLMRGYLGDVQVSISADGTIVALPLSPCAGNKNKSLDDFIAGKIEVMGSDFECKPATGTVLSFMNHVQVQLTSISNKLINKQPLTLAENSFIDVTPIPLSNALRSGVATGTSASLIATVSDVVARAYAFYFVSDLYYQTLSLWERGRAEVAKANSKSPTNKEDEASCNMVVFEKVYNEMMHGLTRTYEMQSQLKTEYATIAAQTNSILEFIDRLNKFDELYHSRFGGGRR